MLGLFEPVCAPWKVDGIPEDFSFGELPPDWDRMGPYLETAMQRVPVSIEIGVQEVLLRPGELHPRPAAGRRRGARAARTTSSPPGSTRSASSPAAASAGCSRTGSSTAAPTSTSPASTSTGCTRYQANPEYRAHAHRRVARHGLPVPLPDAVDADRARREASAVPRPARGARRLLPRRQRLGGRRLVRARRAAEPDGRHAVLGPAELVPLLGGRAPRGPRGRDPHGHVVHVEVPRAGPRRRARCSTGSPRTASTASRASSPTRSGSTRAARSRPTSPSPSSTTTGSGWSPPTPRTGTPRPGCAATSPTTRTRSSPT